MEQILKYFPELSPEQIKQFEALASLYKEWNAKINVISRKDIDQLYERHVLHSLGIARVISFADDSKILDVGTGGGFPGLPLAILFPGAHFYLTDSIGKKIKVVEAISNSIGLTNLNAKHIRSEKVKGQFDFVVSRAVTKLPLFMNWMKGKISGLQKNSMANGVLYLKGENFEAEIEGMNYQYRNFDLSNYYEEPFFETKKVVHIIPSAKPK